MISTKEHLIDTAYQWAAIKEKHLDHLDADIRDTLVLINKHPQLRSMWSCAGHLSEDGEEYSETYIMFAFLSVEAISSFYKLIKEQLPGDYGVQLELIFTQRCQPTGPDGKERPLVDVAIVSFVQRFGMEFINPCPYFEDAARKMIEGRIQFG